MGVLYVGAALVVLIVNYDMIGWAFGQIFAGAFTGLGVAGGTGWCIDPRVQTGGVSRTKPVSALRRLRTLR